ncbi:MAG: hypothetical protein JXB46_03865 [Candidatus Eisenbacteria bacterium]|nr:hypothetical protein [Candidatus Eisenbacteria bacterium]
MPGTLWQRILLVIWVVVAASALALGGETASPIETSDDRLSLSVENMEITELLKLIAAKRQLNIVTSRDVAGQVSANFYNLPLDVALREILEINGFAFSRSDSIIRVFKPVTAGSVRTVTRVFRLRYVKSVEVERVLKNLLSQHGRVVVAPSRDALVVTDVPELMPDLEAVITGLDVQPKQVMIEARLIEVGDTIVSKKGINWADLEGLKIAEITAERGYDRDRQHEEDIAGTTVDTLAKTVSSLISLRGGVLSENEFTLVANFFETYTDSRIVSRPRVMTLDGQEATIIVGTIVPVPLFDFASDTGVRTLSGFQDERVGIELKVTPYINMDGFVTLDINPKVEDITDYITVDGDRQRPIKSTRQAQTTVMIRDGQTVVIGGLLSETETESTAQVPVLGSIPVLQYLFRNRTKDHKTTDLMIFITPRIIDDTSALSQSEQTVLEGTR